MVLTSWIPCNYDWLLQCVVYRIPLRHSDDLYGQVTSCPMMRTTFGLVRPPLDDDLHMAVKCLLACYGVGAVSHELEHGAHTKSNDDGCADNNREDSIGLAYLTIPESSVFHMMDTHSLDGFLLCCHTHVAEGDTFRCRKEYMSLMKR